MLQLSPHCCNLPRAWLWGACCNTWHPVLKHFTVLKLHVCGTSNPDENQADRWLFQMKSTLVVFPRVTLAMWSIRQKVLQLRRPVGTNLELVRRVSYYPWKRSERSVLRMCGPGASGSSYGVGSRGPLKGPWRGSTGQSPRKLLGFIALVKGPERLSWKYFFH